MPDHSSAVYSVKVAAKGSPKEPQLLQTVGDPIAPRRLIDLIESFLPEIDVGAGDDNEERVVTPTSEKTLKYVESEVNDDASELFATFMIGVTGQRASIAKDGTTVFEQSPGHVHEMRCAVLFRLPIGETTGHMAIHVPESRGAYTIIKAHLVSRIISELGDYRLHIDPRVQASAFHEAVAKGLVGAVTLERSVQPADLAERGEETWVNEGADAKIRLTIQSSPRFWLRPNKLKAYIDNPSPENLNAVLDFRGMQFEKARVKVGESGQERTYNLEKLDSGHPMTVDITEKIRLDRDGWPTSDSLQSALRSTIPAAPAPAGNSLDPLD